MRMNISIKKLLFCFAVIPAMLDAVPRNCIDKSLQNDGPVVNEQAPTRNETRVVNPLYYTLTRIERETRLQSWLQKEVQYEKVPWDEWILTDDPELQVRIKLPYAQVPKSAIEVSMYAISRNVVAENNYATGIEESSVS